MTYNVFGGTLNPAQSNPIQSLPKNRLRPILLKPGTMLEIDETFTTI